MPPPRWDLGSVLGAKKAEVEVKMWLSMTKHNEMIVYEGEETASGDD